MLLSEQNCADENYLKQQDSEVDCLLRTPFCQPLISKVSSYEDQKEQQEDTLLSVLPNFFMKTAVQDEIELNSQYGKNSKGERTERHISAPLLTQKHFVACRRRYGGCQSTDMRNAKRSCLGILIISALFIVRFQKVINVYGKSKPDVAFPNRSHVESIGIKGTGHSLGVSVSALR